MKIFENKPLVSSLKNKQQSMRVQTGLCAAGARISFPAALGRVVEGSQVDYL
jgi:hypothetical protein